MCRAICVGESLPLRRAGGTLLAMGVWGMGAMGMVAVGAIGLFAFLRLLLALLFLQLAGLFVYEAQSGAQIGPNSPIVAILVRGRGAGAAKFGEVDVFEAHIASLLPISANFRTRECAAQRSTGTYRTVYCALARSIPGRRRSFPYVVCVRGPYLTVYAHYLRVW